MSIDIIRTMHGLSARGLCRMGPGVRLTSYIASMLRIESFHPFKLKVRVSRHQSNYSLVLYCMTVFCIASYVSITSYSQCNK